MVMVALPGKVFKTLELYAWNGWTWEYEKTNPTKGC